MDLSNDTDKVQQKKKRRRKFGSYTILKKKSLKSYVEKGKGEKMCDGSKINEMNKRKVIEKRGRRERIQLIRSIIRTRSAREKEENRVKDTTNEYGKCYTKMPLCISRSGVLGKRDEREEKNGRNVDVREVKRKIEGKRIEAETKEELKGTGYNSICPVLDENIREREERKLVLEKNHCEKEVTIKGFINVGSRNKEENDKDELWTEKEKEKNGGKDVRREKEKEKYGVKDMMREKEKEKYGAKDVRKENEKEKNGEEDEKRKEKCKIDNEKDRKKYKKKENEKKCKEKSKKDAEKDKFVVEYMQKRITRAQSNKAMEKKEIEGKKVNDGELDIENKEGQKEKEIHNEVEEKYGEESGHDKEDKMESEKEKSDGSEVDKMVRSEDKKKKIKKKKEIFTLGVRSGGDYVLRTHRIVRRMPKQYKCSLCTSIFKTVKDRNEHVQDIHDIECFKCTECDKVFKTESSMKRHQFEHKEGGKTYPCSECEKVFYFSSHLKRHEGTHSEEPLYKCLYSECHKLKGWRDMSDYNRHMLRHRIVEDKF